MTDDYMPLPEYSRDELMNILNNVMVQLYVAVNGGEPDDWSTTEIDGDALLVVATEIIREHMGAEG